MVGDVGGYIFAGQPTPGEPEAFKLAAALALALMLMVLVLTTGGILLWHRHSWGYVIATIAGIQGSLYLVVLAVNAALFIRWGLAEASGELLVWGVLAVATAASTGLLLVNVRERWRNG